MNDNYNQKNSKIEKKKNVWRQLRTLIWIYGASIVIPAVVAMFARTDIDHDLADLGYEITYNDEMSDEVKLARIAQYLLPGKVLLDACDIIKDSKKWHNDSDFQNRLIQTGLENGTIKAIGANNTKH